MVLNTKIKIAEDVIRFRLTKKPRTIVVAWLVTGRCNGACQYCQWKDLRRMPELDTSSAVDLIDQMARAGVRILSFTGGEPLVRSDIDHLVAHAIRQGMSVKLNSNGFLAKNHREMIASLDLFQVSLDGPPGVSEQVRGKGTTEAAVSALNLAKELGVPAHAIVTMTRPVIQNLDDVLDFGQGLNVSLRFQPLHTPRIVSEDRGNLIPQPDEFESALRKLLREKGTPGSRGSAIGTTYSELQYYFDTLRNPHETCPGELVTATILPDGKLMYCGNADEIETQDTTTQGFEAAFQKLRLPPCRFCTCVGKIRLAKAFQLDAGVALELLASQMGRLKA